MNNAQIWLNMLEKTMTEGIEICPRGLRIKELMNFTLTISPADPFMGFPDRKYDVDYFKKEMLWKLGANRMDDSIKQHAKMWESVQNPDGSFNSNYGHYWFGPQMGFMNVVLELIRDRDSRQAVIPMLSKEHMTPDTIDKVCTTAVGFHIRNHQLHMSVQMRSSDQIFGLGTDIPTFSFLYRMVYIMLQSHYKLSVGDLTVAAMSSHIYERHFIMVEKILQKGLVGYENIEMPWIYDDKDALKLMADRGKITNVSCSIEKWLTS